MSWTENEKVLCHEKLLNHDYSCSSIELFYSDKFK